MPDIDRRLADTLAGKRGVVDPRLLTPDERRLRDWMLAQPEGPEMWQLTRAAFARSRDLGGAIERVLKPRQGDGGSDEELPLWVAFPGRVPVCRDCGVDWAPVRRGECSQCGSDAGPLTSPPASTTPEEA